MDIKLLKKEIDSDNASIEEIDKSISCLKATGNSDDAELIENLEALRDYLEVESIVYTAEYEDRINVK